MVVGVAGFGLEEEGQVRPACLVHVALLGRHVLHLCTPLGLCGVQACLHPQGELPQVHLSEQLGGEGFVHAEGLQGLGGFLLSGLKGQVQRGCGLQGVQPKVFSVGSIFFMGQEAPQLMPRKVLGLIHDGKGIFQAGHSVVGLTQFMGQQLSEDEGLEFLQCTSLSAGLGPGQVLHLPPCGL